jgi:type III secretion protein K
MNVAACADQAVDPLGLLRLVMRLQLQPQADLHPSWLPPDWPARYRQLQRLGPGAQAALADWMRPRMPAVGLNFDARRKRLLLLDGKSLRRLAMYCGLCAHAPLLRQRGPAGAQVRRQARRIDRDAQHVVLERLPALDSLAIDTRRIDERPACAGRVMVARGYRLLLGAVAAEGEEVLQRLQRKLPRRAASLPLPSLQPRQLNQLTELMLMGVVPERLPQWDWLF